MLVISNTTPSSALHENGHMRRAILFVFSYSITFYQTSPTDATETLVSATIASTVERRRTSN
jgi:hypothetical protein